MSTLLLRLAGPLQSWGVDSRFNTRSTQRYPSKSGAVGLLAAALGRRRDEDLSDLNSLRFGVRVDKEGELMMDFHTAHGKDPKDSFITYRYYLADAVFLAAFESDDTDFLRRIDDALRHPVFPLFLGRRSCPPTMPLSLGIRDCCLVDALKNEEWRAPQWYKKRGAPQLRVVTDAMDSDKYPAAVRDVPLSFSPMRREYGFRGAADRGFVSPEHDAFGELEDEPCI